MKVLIWILCMFIPGFIVGAQKNLGVTLGAIPTIILYAPFVFGAIHLCKKWDERKLYSNNSQNASVNHNICDNKNKVCIAECTKCGYRFRPQRNCPKCDNIGKTYLYVSPYETQRCIDSSPYYTSKGTAAPNEEDNSTKTLDIMRACQSMAVLSSRFIGPVCDAINSEFIFDDSIIKLDLNIFALFWARFKCTLGCNDETVVKTVTGTIITYFSLEAEKQFGIKQEKFIEVADNRLPVFDEIYMKSTDPRDFVKTLLTELGILLAHDIVNEGYEPFSFRSPMPVIGFNQQSMIDLSVAEFIENFDKAISIYISAVRKSYYMD